MSRFAAIGQKVANDEPTPEAVARPPQENRIGRKAISGYFSPQMSIAMRITATRLGLTLQEAMIKSFDDWLRKNGESPIGN